MLLLWEEEADVVFCPVKSDDGLEKKRIYGHLEGGWECADVRWSPRKYSDSYPALTFNQEKSLRNKGTSVAGGFHLKDNERENWKKLKKRDQPWREKRGNENGLGWEGMKICMREKLKRGENIQQLLSSFENWKKRGETTWSCF